MAWTPEGRAKYAQRYKERQKLGITPQQLREKRLQKSLHPALRHPTIEAMFQGKNGEALIETRRNAMKYVRLVADGHPKLEALAEAWDKLPEAKRERTPLDSLCEKVDLPVPEFLSVVAPRAYEMGHRLAKLFVGLAQPELAQVAIASAMDVKNGFKDRQMMLQAGGTAPSPKGINIAVQQNTQVNSSGMPDFSSDVIDLVEAVRGEEPSVS